MPTTALNLWIFSPFNAVLASVLAQVRDGSRPPILAPLWSSFDDLIESIQQKQERFSNSHSIFSIVRTASQRISLALSQPYSLSSVYAKLAGPLPSLGTEWQASLRPFALLIMCSHRTKSWITNSVLQSPRVCTEKGIGC